MRKAKKVITSDFTQLLCDRFTAAELAEFLDISVEDFCEMFEEDIEYNYTELCEFIGFKEADNDNGRSNDYDQYDDDSDYE